LTATAAPPRWRPVLLPKSRWARITLLLLVLFALLRCVLWASVQPGWLAPDEDYHWLYVNYLVVKHRVPNLHQGEYTQELDFSVQAVQLGTYLQGARHVYTGGPHAILSQLGHLSRQPTPPAPRPVLEAPLYYVPAAIVDKLVWSKVSVTRLTVIRYYSALLGALTIYFAWLLAAQILAREWQQLGAAALASLQMILAFSSSTITNDAGVAVTLTATLAWCAWMLRGPPHPRQGIGLGVLVALALLTKATMLALVIVVPVMFLLLWRAFPQARRQVGGAFAWTFGVSLILAGWWYVYVHNTTNSFLGEANFPAPAPKTAAARAAAHAAAVTAAHAPGLLRALQDMPATAWLWIQQVYRNYWFSYLFYEVQARGIWFWLPVVGIVIVAAGFVVYLIRTRRTTFRPLGAGRRSVLLITFTALLLCAVPMWKDSWSLIHGGAFLTSQGRFLTPAYPGLAVIAVLAIGELTGRRRRLFPAALAVFVAGAFVLYWHSWIKWALESFYGAANGHWLTLLLHASYDKPTFITQYSLAAIWLVALAAFAAAFLLTGLAWRRGQRVEAADAPTHERPGEPVSGAA
jgi:hypothetical protein